MQSDELRALVAEIQRQRSERQTVELKTTRGGFPGRIYDSISAFSNQDEGGIIIFGVAEKPNFEAVGVYDPDDVQKKIMEACGQMEPKVRPLITLCEIGGKMVVAAEIPSVDRSLRPVFYRGAGRMKGSYIRVGDADEPMTEYEIYSYEAFRKGVRDELRVVAQAKLDFFDHERLTRYLSAVKEERRNLSTNVSDAEILELMGVVRDGKPTLAGLMTFSKYPQTYFPQLCVTAVVVPGTEIGDADADDARFLDNARITGAIPDMLEESIEFVRRNSRTKTVVDENGRRQDRPEYPVKAIREAILNALIHRDFSVYAESVAVSIEMYRDRFVVRSRGGLCGGGSLNLLGKERPETRNPALVNMLELLHVCENRYSGVPTIRRELALAGMAPPEFAIRRGDFEVTFWNNASISIANPETADVSAALLAFCRTPRTRQELAEFVQKSQYYTMTTLVQPLIDQGKIKLSIPDKPKSSKQRFIAAER